MPVYSVVLPVYNVEAYLAECLDSILAQDTKSEYEVILVDDGSTDTSGEICDNYAQKYSNFHVIHQKNQKLSCARNAGLRIATGEFVIFFDSDDVWASNLLSAMDTVIDKKPDMTLFLYEGFGDGVERFVRYPPEFPSGESGEAYMQRCFSHGKIPPIAAWTYMYRRSFLLENGLEFEAGLEHSEDLDFNMAAIPAAQKVESIDQVLYYYRQRNTSMTATISPRRMMAHFGVVIKWYRNYQAAALANQFCGDCLSFSRMGSSEEVDSLIALAEENRDILQKVTGWKMRFARFLYRAFGFYRGGAIYLSLIAFKHFLQGKGKPSL